MIKSIRLENFMAHKATSIDLAPGVTVITGPNNIGKSAIVEGIRSLVYNPAPKNVIRHGAQKALVHLELDSGEIITWQRQEKNAAYIIAPPGQQPETYHKFGRDIPQDVRSLLRLDLVETDSDKIDIHLGNQRQPIFLLDRPGSHAAAFFAASTEADYLLKMQQLLKSKIDQGKRDQKRLDAELVLLQGQIDHYLPLDDLEVRVQEAEALHALILATARQLPVLAESIARLEETRAELRRQEEAASALQGLTGPPGLGDVTGLTVLLSELADTSGQHGRERNRTTVLGELGPPPALETTAHLETMLAQTREAQRRQTSAQSQARALSPLTLPPITAEVANLQELVDAYETMLARSEAWRRRQGMVSGVAEPPELEAAAALEGLIREIGREEAQQKNLDRATRILAGLASPPAPGAVADLEHCLKALEQAEAQASRQQADLLAVASRLDRQKAEIQAYLQDTGTCPLCGSPLELAHFLEEHHG